MNKYTATDLAYAAGLVDGEGTVHISKRTSNGNRHPFNYTCVVGAQMTRPEALQLMKTLFGGSFTQVPSRTKADKPIYSWRVQGEAAAETLRTILPFLKIKQRQAEVVLAFREHVIRQNGSRGRRTTDEDLKVRDTFYQESRKLNV